MDDKWNGVDIIMGANQQVLAAGAGIITIFSQTLTTDDSTWNGYSARNESGVLSAGGTSVRVTFEAPATGTSVVDHAAIGVEVASPAFDTVATPVELKFSGASGFSISNGSTITSDWATLSFTASDRLVVILDFNATGGVARKVSLNAGSGYKLGATYNSASPGGLTTFAWSIGFNKIEAR